MNSYIVHVCMSACLRLCVRLCLSTTLHSYDSFIYIWLLDFEINCFTFDANEIQEKVYLTTSTILTPNKQTNKQQPHWIQRSLYLCCVVDVKWGWFLNFSWTLRLQTQSRNYFALCCSLFVLKALTTKAFIHISFHLFVPQKMYLFQWALGGDYRVQSKWSKVALPLARYESNV